MKNIWLLIMPVILYFPEISFCQTVDNTIPVSIMFASNNPGTDKGDLNSCTALDFNNSIIIPQQLAVATITESDHCFTDGKCYSAFIDNQSFALKGYRPVSAVLVDEPLALNEEAGARSVIDITIGGKSDITDSTNLQNETIRLRLALVEPISPGPGICSVTLNHKTKAYTMVKGDASNVEVTDFIWSMDRKSFILSIEFNCTMRSSGFPADGQRDVNLKGKLVRVRVTNAGAVSASE
jgi:hypothetical protein